MTTESTTTRRHRPVWMTVVIAAAVGLFYAYVVWNAVDLLVRQTGGTLGLNGYGWFVHLSAVVFPLAAFIAAFALGYRRRWWELALVMITGLALSFAFWMNIVAYAVESPALYAR